MGLDMPNSKLKCKQCKEYFPRGQMINSRRGKFCSVDCMSDWGLENQQKGREIRSREKRAETRERKEQLKTAGDCIKEAQSAVNRYIRLRDRNKPCISCGSFPAQTIGGSFDAGHYRSRGAASHLRFNVLNIHKQCVKCNRFGSGMAVEYRIRLIDKIGVELVEQLEMDNTPKKFTIDYLKRVKGVFSRRANWYAKRD